MRCDECRFFLLKQGSPNRGECRRRPPATSQGNLYGHWPIVDRDEWCGEFEYIPAIYAAKITKHLED